MNDIELILTMLAEATTTELHKTRDSVGFKKLHTDAREGGEIAGITRKNIEKKTKSTLAFYVGDKEFDKILDKTLKSKKVKNALSKLSKSI